MISVRSLGSFYPLMRKVPLTPAAWRHSIAGWPDRSSGRSRRTAPWKQVGSSLTPPCTKRNSVLPPPYGPPAPQGDVDSGG